MPLLAAQDPVRPQSQDLKGQVVTGKNAPIPGASCTLTGPTLPDEGLAVTAGEKGEFSFPGLAPGAYALTCAAVGYEPVFKGDIEISGQPPPFLQLALPAEVLVKQTVEVREKAATVEQQHASAASTLSASQLQALPLIEQKFKAALPLVPGVIRTPDGKTNIKGAVESQGLLLVDSAEMVDPVTGAFSIEIPIDAVGSLQVYKSTYRADYGRFSGGLATVETKAPSGKFDYSLSDFLPTPRVKGGHIVGIADDEPRLYVTGPLLENKLNISEAFEYDVLKQPVRGLAYPANEIKTQGFNSFTSLQYILSGQHLLNASLDFFPKRVQFADISSLVPQTASSDYGQQGFAAGLTDRYLFSSGSILSTLFQFTRFDSNAHGQGPLDQQVTPEGWSGNFFNTYNRTSDQQQLSQTFEFARKDWHGKHQPKIGVEIVRRTYTGTSDSRPVLVQRQDGTVAERIDFTGPGKLDATDVEAAAFAEDHWAFNRHLAADAGVRFSGQSIGDPATAAPRFGVVYSPGEGGKTIFRSGIGLFYDRVPLLAGDFVQNPTRVVTCFDPACGPQGVPVTFQNAYVKFGENGRQIVPTHDRLASTPHNVTWSVEADRELRPNVLLRLSYLSSRTYQEFVINPLQVAGTQPALLLSNTGVLRYHEFESTLRFHPTERADINISYVNSLARGDLNTLSSIYVPFEQPVIRPNEFGFLPSNVPNRVVTWGRFKLPREYSVSPVLDVHSGFPYSAFNVVENYASAPNSLRFPYFASLDVKLTKDFLIPRLPWFEKHKFRIAFTVYNLTDHANPRDVYSNVTSPLFGSFVGLQHRFYDAYLDIVY